MSLNRFNLTRTFCYVSLASVLSLHKKQLMTEPAAVSIMPQCVYKKIIVYMFCSFWGFLCG